jgi:hypothetical protein
LKKERKTAGAVVVIIQVSVEMKSDPKEKGEKRGGGGRWCGGGLLNLTIDNSQNFERNIYGRD